MNGEKGSKDHASPGRGGRKPESGKSFLNQLYSKISTARPPLDPRAPVYKGDLVKGKASGKVRDSERERERERRRGDLLYSRIL